MKTKGLFAAAMLVVSASAALADGDQHVRYQNVLLNRPLNAADQNFCNQMTGGQQPAMDKCHITRLFIQDILRNAEQGFPPLTDIRYAQSKDEKSRILDKLTQYGG